MIENVNYDEIKISQIEGQNPIINILINRKPTKIEFDYVWINSLDTNTIKQALVSRGIHTFILQNQNHKILITKDDMLI